LTLTAIVAAGCGGGETKKQTGIASLVPADAPAYFDVVARPDASAAGGLDGAVDAIAGRDVDLNRELARAINAELSSEGADQTYEDDIEPWLGDRAGGFASVVSDEIEGALIVETTDGSRALDVVGKAIEDSGTELRDEQHGGVEYRTDGEGALGIVDDRLVIGTPGGFEAAVDASKGDSLADSSEFDDPVGADSPDNLATAYAEPRGAVDLLERSGEVPPGQLDAITKQLGAGAGEPVVLTATADSEGFKFEGTGPAGEAKPQPVLDDLPSQSWAAAGVVGVGEALRRSLDQIRSSVPGGFDLDEVVRRETGIDLEADLLSWLGDVSAFLGATSVIDLKLGAVMTTTDQRASAAALDRLRWVVARNLPAGQAEVGKLGVSGDAGFTVTFSGFPAPLNVVQRGDRVVVALGDATTDQAFSGGKLGSSSEFERAQSGLGEGFEPSVYVAFGPMAKFLETLPNAESDPDLANALPYLKRLDYFVVGSRREGDRASFGAVLGLP
jgi:hypothetical protein